MTRVRWFLSIGRVLSPGEFWWSAALVPVYIVMAVTAGNRVGAAIQLVCMSVVLVRLSEHYRAKAAARVEGERAGREAL